MQYKPTGELQAEAERLAAQAKAARESGEDPMAPLVEAALKKPSPGAAHGPASPSMSPRTPVATSGASIGVVSGAGAAPPSAFSGPGATQPRSQPAAAGAEEEPSFHEPYSRDIHHGEHMFPGVKGHETEEFERSESYASPDDVRPEILAAVERHERQGWTPEELEHYHAVGERHTHAQAEIQRRARGAAAGVTETAGAAAGMAAGAAQRTKEAAMETGGAAVEGAKGAMERGSEMAGEAAEGVKGAAARGTEKAAETAGAVSESAKGAAQAAGETAGAAAQSAKETTAAAAETAAGAAQSAEEATLETAGTAAERTKAAAAGAAETATETAAEAGRRAQGVVAQAREAVATAVRVTVERLSHAVGAAKERVGIPAEQPLTEAAREKAEEALVAAKHRAGVPEEQPLGEAAREAGHSAAEAARTRASGLAHTVKDKVSQVPVQMREMYAHGKALAQEKDAARSGTGGEISGTPETQAAQRKAYTEGTFEKGQRPGGSFEAEGTGEEHHPSYAPHFKLPMPPEMVDQSLAGRVSESHAEGVGQQPHQQGQSGGAEVVDESGRQSLGVEK